MLILHARSAAELEALRPRWEALYAAGNHTLFQSFQWNLLAARAFGHREAPEVAYAENGSGAAIIPAVRVENGARLGLLGETLFDYRDVLAAGDSEALSAAWRELARLDLPFAAAGIRDPAHWPGFRTGCFADAPYVEGIDGVSFAGRHRRSARLLSRLQREGVSLRRHSGENSALVRGVYRRKAAQLGPRARNLFADSARIDFMVAAAGLNPAATDIFTLENGSTLVAALVTFCDGSTRRFYTIWHDPAWARFSPGIALLFEVTRRSLEDGPGCDFMTGTQPHKSRFATGAMPLRKVEAVASELAGMGASIAPSLVA